MADDKPIIVIKKKGGHGGHHGGAWKVAFADFMTAMMAFFLVMWLVGTADSTTRANIAQYFRQPGFFEGGSGTPLMQGHSGILKEAYVPPHPAEQRQHPGKGDDLVSPQMDPTPTETDSTPSSRDLSGSDDPSAATTGAPGDGSAIAAWQEGRPLSERQVFQGIAQEIRRRAQQIPEIADRLGDLEVKLESDGLVIEIMDKEDKSMFASASAQILPEAQSAFVRIAELLSDFPNRIDIIGHTDARPFSTRARGYSNWDLSADRANTARRLLEGSGIAAERILSVVGRADRDLKTHEDPFAAANRRISLKMRFSADTVVAPTELPSALDELRDFARQSRELPPVSEPDSTPMAHSPDTITPPPAATPSPIARGRRSDSIALPDSPPPTENPPLMPQDKIFGDRPVFGPPPLFSDF